MYITINKCDKCGKEVNDKEIVKHNNRIIYRHKDIGIMMMKEQTSSSGRNLFYSMILCRSCATKLGQMMEKFMGSNK